MKKNECPAPVRREIALWERNGYELLDVDVWDFPLSDEYLLTFRKKDDPCETVPMTDVLPLKVEGGMVMGVMVNGILQNKLPKGNEAVTVKGI